LTWAVNIFFRIDPFLAARVLARQADPLLIRPPGALPEMEYLGRCVRCGECLKASIGNPLHSTWMAALKVSAAGESGGGRGRMIYGY